MDSLDLVGLIVEQWGTAGMVAGFLALKGCAAVIANNFHTEEWGKAGQVIDWLASSNKKAKLTGNADVDESIVEEIAKKESANLLVKVLSKIS